MKKFISIMLIFAALWAEKKISSNYLVVLSMDGFRYNYTEKASTPNFDKIAEQGVKSAMVPAFPSKTFPNHYTMATGLYPDHHGLIFNTFYDYKNDRWYKINDRSAVEDGSFYGGEPIWSTAQKQGVTTATLFWVGSEAPVDGIQPTYWKKYDHEMPFDSRIDTVISWLQKPKAKRPHLIMWYLHEPDSWGHKFGPDHEIMPDKIAYLDNYIGKLLEEINSLPMADSINIILTADHGMGEIDNDHVVYLDDYIKKSWIIRETGSNPIWMLEPEDNYADSVIINLQKAEHIRAWKKSEIPDYLHYGTNENIMPIVVAADSAWSVGWNSIFKNQTYSGGTHGYDPMDRDMHAIFLAIGPDFKQNYKHEKFDNINLYELMAKLLNIVPAKNDGNLEKVKDMLKE